MPFVKPILRSCKFLTLRAMARFYARRTATAADAPMVFLVGCGRSGTTILGNILSTHPRIDYLNEPYHFWAEINPQTDVTGLFTTKPAKYFMAAEDVSSSGRAKFASLFGRYQCSEKHLVEKTPHNACRISFLRELMPNAKFINIVRNGLLVSRSIKVAAEENDYRLFHRPSYNPWWGHDNARWRHLVDHCSNEFQSCDLLRLETNLQKAAVEWLVNVQEFDRNVTTLGDDQLTVTYQQLTSEPNMILSKICDFLEIEFSPSWLADQKIKLRPERSIHSEEATLLLPLTICKMFNDVQEKYEFEGRAIEL